MFSTSISYGFFQGHFNLHIIFNNSFQRFQRVEEAISHSEAEGQEEGIV